jgi:dihydrofolate synthase/folylpolyglutamate synthase
MLRSTTSYDAALAFLWQRIDYERALVVSYGERAYKLDRMRELLARLGDPQTRLSIVHVAGTKGKGSTAAMTAAVLTAAGYRTGLYSSPHLQTIEERMAVDGQNCPRDQFAGWLERLRPVVESMDAAAARLPGECGPTYFELTTALALLHFADQRVDAAVLEVGMGGRLDSTNVCLPLVSVITSISFDHTKQLGNTLAAIAGEKAGIIKAGVPVVSGVVPDEPRKVIEAASQAAGSRLVQLGRDFDFSYRPPLDCDRSDHCARFDYRYTSGQSGRQWNDIELNLLGRHQAANAAVALATLEQLSERGFRIPESAVRAGLKNVRWPARVEVVGRRPTIVIDAAHNLASASALIETIDESFAAERRILVFASTKEKDLRGMLALLLPRFDHVIFTRYLNNPRFVPPEELAELAAELGATRPPASQQLAADPAAAWQQARQLAGPSDLICVTGSFFIAAEMREQIDRAPLG